MSHSAPSPSVAEVCGAGNCASRWVELDVYTVPGAGVANGKVEIDKIAYLLPWLLGMWEKMFHLGGRNRLPPNTETN